jgi:hypothetical protein
VLFVEEIQSDWHQKGKQEGYKKVTPEVLGMAYNIASHNIFGKNYKDLSVTQKTEAENYAQDLRTMSSVLYDAMNKGVPDAPLKPTAAWAMLGFKRILQTAAEEGYNKVAWTTGETQADRYDLSKQISSIHYSPLNEFVGDKEIKKYAITAIGKNGERVVDSNYTPEQLPGVVGKEIANKIINDPNKRGEIHGLDLKVGGEGMAGFYDQILPVAVGKYLRKMDSSVQARKESLPGGEDGNFTAWSVPITPKIKQSVLHGQTLY